MIAPEDSGAVFLTVAMGFTGIPRVMAAWIGEQGFKPWQLIAVLTVLFILPSVKAAGIDLLWFGIFVVLIWVFPEIVHSRRR